MILPHFPVFWSFNSMELVWCQKLLQCLGRSKEPPHAVTVGFPGALGLSLRRAQTAAVGQSACTPPEGSEGDKRFCGL